MLIAALSVVSLAVILWKISQLLRLGALRSGQTTDAGISRWCAGEDVSAVLAARGGMRAEFASDAIRLRESADWDESSRKEEIARIARARLQEISAGLRALELVVTIAPLLGEAIKRIADESSVSSLFD